MPKDREVPKEPSIEWLWAALIVIVTLCIIYWLVVSLTISSGSNRGTFGDMFGGLNALFSGCAFAGVIYAIFVQRTEIRFAKTELAQTKRIFEEQSASLELQNLETRKQIFENTFFQLLRLHTEVTRAIDVVDGNTTKKGVDAFSAFEAALPYHERKLRQTSNDQPTHASIYKRLYDRSQNDLGHYFRSLYRILKFVDESSIDNKKSYTSIVRGLVSNPELHILLYNGASEFGQEKMKPLLEKYAFFDNLPASRIQNKDVLSEYAPSAFGENDEILELLKK